MVIEPVIRVGVDGSWRDTGALEWALQESSLRHEPIHAVHVIEEGLRDSPHWEPTVVDEAAMKLIDEVQQYVKTTEPRLDHQVDLQVGPPAATLASLAEGCRMLVVGRRGLGGFKRLLIGSTSDAVANEASVPVVVVPEGWKAQQRHGPVVVGLDDSSDNEAAIEFAATAAAERFVPLRMVHVWDLPYVYSWDAMNAASQSEEWAEAAQGHFDELAAQWRDRYPMLEIQADVIQGHPVGSLVETAELSEAQLLVLGGRKHRRLTTALMGSVARGVLHHARCPVAIVHLPRRPESGSAGRA
jgi:nucleotide-binding universal stress UspA family protein